MALMGGDMKHLPRLQAMGDAIDRELEGAAQQQGPLLVQVGVIGNDRARCDVDPALSDMVRVDVAAEVAGNDLTRRTAVKSSSLMGAPRSKVSLYLDRRGPSERPPRHHQRAAAWRRLARSRW